MTELNVLNSKFENKEKIKVENVVSEDTSFRDLVTMVVVANPVRVEEMVEVKVWRKVMLYHSNNHQKH